VSTTPFSGTGPVLFAKNALTTTGVTTLIWLMVTLLTRPESDEVLLKFYRKVRPDVRGWRPIAQRLPELATTRDLGRNAVDWLLGCAMVYLVLFGTGKLILQKPLLGILLLVAGCAIAMALYARLARRDWSDPASEPVVLKNAQAESRTS